MTYWHDLGTAVDRDDLIVASPITPVSDHYPVDVWSLAGPKRLSRFDSVLDFGGRRLALVTEADRAVVVAAAYDRLGVAAYDATTGDLLWRRADLKRAQSVTSAGRVVTISFDRGPTQVIDGLTGQTTATVRGARAVWHGRDRSLAAAHVTGHVALLDTPSWTEVWRRRVHGFSVLAAAIAPHGLIASDVVDLGVGARSGARCAVYGYDLSGHLVAHYQSPPSANCPALAWDDEAREWVGIESDVNADAPDTLIRWSPDGDVLMRMSLRGALHKYWFLPSGRLVISDRAEVIDTRDGQVVAALVPEP